MRSLKRKAVGRSVLSPVTRGRDAVAERLESRTLLSAALAVPADVPLISLSGAFAHFNSSAKAGKKFSETITVTNNGNATITGTLPILVDTSPDQTLASGTVLTTISKNINIKSRKSARITLSLTAPAEAGSFHLVMELDPQSTLGDDIVKNTFSSASTVNVKTGPFKKGAIAGQNGWGIFNSVGSPASTAVVSTSVTPPTHGNKDTIVVTRAAGEAIGVAPSAPVRSSTPFTVTAQVQVNFQTSANGPFFGLNLLGNNGAIQLGSFGVDAANGDVVDFANGPGSFLLSDGSNGAPAPLTAGTWNTFKVVADFTAGSNGPVTLTYFLNGTQVDTETVGTAVISFANAEIFSQQAIPAGGSDAAGTAAFDNYSVTTTAPSTLPASKGLTFP
jgi:hypothetical protein